MTTHNWTPERTATMARLWSEGVSGTVIGKALGITKNSVIGKVWRMGLPNRATTTRETSVRQPRSRPQPAPFVMREKRKPPVFFHGIRQDEPVSKNLSITELTATTCKFPHGHPWQAEFGFCGEKRVAYSSYCAYHKELCRRPFEYRV